MRDNNNRISSDPALELLSQDNNIKRGYSLPLQLDVVKLPSEGKFYPEGHPLHNKDFVEVKGITTKEEEILTSESLIKQGIVLDHLLQSLLIDKTININDIFSCDKDAILMEVRKINYGPEYATSLSCMKCGRSKEKTFNLEDFPIKHFPEDIPVSENGTFEIVLEDEKLGRYALEMRLLKGKDHDDLKRQSEKKKKHNLKDTPIIDVYKRMILSVNGDSNGHNIEDFISSLPRQWSTFLRKEYKRIIPGVDRSLHYECDFCQAESEVEMPISPSFFWTD